MMPYLNFYKNYLQIQTTEFLNGLWFWLRRIPLIGQSISPKFYGMRDLKTVILVIFKWLSLPLTVLKKSVLVFIAWLVAFGVKNLSLQKEIVLWDTFRIDYPEIFHWTLTIFLLFCVFEQLSFVMASSSSLFKGIAFAKMFRLSYGDTLKKLNRINLVHSLLAYVFPLGILGLIYHQSFVAIILPSSFRLLALNLALFLVSKNWWVNVLDSYQKKIFKYSYNLVIFGGGLFGLIYLTLIHMLEWTALSAWFILILASVSFLLSQKKKLSQRFIQSIFRNLAHHEQIVTEAKSNQSNTGLKAAQKSSQKIEVTDEQELFDKFSGIQLLNRLLFKRYRKVFKKKLLYRLGGLGLTFLLILGIYGYLAIRFGKTDYLTFNQVGNILPSIFFIMYLASISKEVVAIYYTKCDQAMLNYPFYRTEQTILQSFIGRLKQSFMVNTSIVVALFVNVFAGILLFGKDIPLSFYSLIVFYGVAVNLLFSFHELFLYYILQPFDREGNTKNPIFTVINGIFYYFCIQNYQFANRFDKTTTYVLTISIISVVYVSLGLIIIKLEAPKRFKLK